MGNKQRRKRWLKLLEGVPFLMQSNLNDDIDYNPEKHPRRYAELVLSEVAYGRECLDEPDPIWSKERLDEIEKVCNQVINE